jgi:hypothetical protein
VPAHGRSARIKGEYAKLINGDLLHGKFIGHDQAKGLRWKHPHVDAELLINPGCVANMALKTIDPPADAKRHACKVKLVNGDEISGELKQMKSGKLLLNTWFADELAIDQRVIISLTPGYTKDKFFLTGQVTRRIGRKPMELGNCKTVLFPPLHREPCSVALLIIRRNAPP